MKKINGKEVKYFQGNEFFYKRIEVFDGTTYRIVAVKRNVWHIPYPAIDFYLHHRKIIDNIIEEKNELRQLEN